MTDVHGDVMVEGTTTWGAGSPGVVFGPVTYALDLNNRKVPVQYRRARASRVTARSSGLVATAASVVSAVCAVLALMVPVPVTEVWEQVRISETPGDVWLLIARVGAFALVLMLGLVVSVAGWSAFRRRRLALPKIGRRLSPFRSLVPADPRSGRFVRTTPYARCSECAEDGRDETARVRRARRSDAFGAYTRCRIGHTIRFRENSLFARDWGR